MDDETGPAGAYQMPNANDVFAGSPQYAQQLAVAQQQQAQAQQESLYGPQLRSFWEGQMQEVSQVGNDPAEFKNHQLPLARIKKIMKSDEDVRMISAEAPVLFAKACEMFILELTLRSWVHAEEGRRRTLQRSDVATAITKAEAFEFLTDIVPQEELKPEGLAADGAAAAVAATSPPESLPVPSLPPAAAAYTSYQAYPSSNTDNNTAAAGLVPMAGQQQQQLQWQPASAAAAGDQSSVAVAGQVPSGEVPGL